MARKAGDGAGKPVPSELPVVERRRKAEEAALRLLATRERSAVELKQRLRTKGYDGETVEFVLDRLQRWRFQDDRRFAEGFAASSVKSRGLAGRVVQNELRRRGIDKELAAQAATISPEEERENAARLAEKRWRRLAAYPPDVRRRRVTGFLARRGYGPEVVAEVIETLAAADGPRGESDPRDGVRSFPPRDRDGIGSSSPRDRDDRDDDELRVERDD